MGMVLERGIPFVDDAGQERDNCWSEGEKKGWNLVHELALVMALVMS